MCRTARLSPLGVFLNWQASVHWSFLAKQRVSVASLGSIMYGDLLHSECQRTSTRTSRVRRRLFNYTCIWVCSQQCNVYVCVSLCVVQASECVCMCVWACMSCEHVRWVCVSLYVVRVCERLCVHVLHAVCVCIRCPLCVTLFSCVYVYMCIWTAMYSCDYVQNRYVCVCVHVLHVVCDCTCYLLSVLHCYCVCMCTRACLK